MKICENVVTNKKILMTFKFSAECDCFYLQKEWIPCWLQIPNYGEKILAGNFELVFILHLVLFV